MKTITVGKSRKITRLGKKESWLRTEVSQEFEEEPSLTEIKDMLADVEYILEMEERDERIYWKAENK